MTSKSDVSCLIRREYVCSVMSDKNDACKIFSGKQLCPKLSKKVVPALNDDINLQ